MIPTQTTCMFLLIWKMARTLPSLVLPTLQRQTNVHYAASSCHDSSENTYGIYSAMIMWHWY